MKKGQSRCINFLYQKGKFFVISLTILVLLNQTELVFSNKLKNTPLLINQPECSGLLSKKSIIGLAWFGNTCFFDKKPKDYILSPGRDSIERLRESRKLSSDILDYGLQIAFMEQEYDRYLNNTLRQYFKFRTYLVDIRLDFKKLEKRGMKTLKPSQPDDQPLPGMPFIPDNIRRKFNMQEINVFYGDYDEPILQLKKMIIVIYADTIYTDQELEFMKLLVSASLKTEPQRDDQVQVLKIPFPNQLILDRESEECPDEKSSLHKYLVMVGLIIMFFLSVFTLIMVLYFASRSNWKKYEKEK